MKKIVIYLLILSNLGCATNTKKSEDEMVLERFVAKLCSDTSYSCISDTQNICGDMIVKSFNSCKKPTNASSDGDKKLYYRDLGQCMGKDLSKYLKKEEMTNQSCNHFLGTSMFDMRSRMAGSINTGCIESARRAGDESSKMENLCGCVSKTFVNSLEKEEFFKVIEMQTAGISIRSVPSISNKMASAMKYCKK